LALSKFLQLLQQIENQQQIKLFCFLEFFTKFFSLVALALFANFDSKNALSALKQL
jgi:hypothetical protein